MGSLHTKMASPSREKRKLLNMTYIWGNRLKDKQRDGVGIMFWPDGTKYEGQFRHDKMCGKGRKIYSNGEYYVGEFANDMAHG